MSTPVLDYLSANQDRFICELSEYLRFPSVSAQPAHQKDVLACAEWLRAHCAKIGLETETVATKGNPVVLAWTKKQPGSNKPHYVVYGHYDVQPPEPHELWHPPGSAFQPRIENGNIYARGSTDNKGQVGSPGTELEFAL